MDGGPPFSAAVLKRGREAATEGLWPMLSAGFGLFPLALCHNLEQRGPQRQVTSVLGVTPRRVTRWSSVSYELGDNRQKAVTGKRQSV